jgi:hypothetical protein
MAVSYENQLPGNSLSAAARASAPTTVPISIAGRQRTRRSRPNRVSATAAAIAIPVIPSPARRVRRSFHDRISAYRRRNISGIST